MDMSSATTSANAAAWFEIGVKNLDKAAKFYGAVLATQLRREMMGPTEIAIFPYDGGMSGSLYESSDVGGAAPVVHLNAPAPLEDALIRVTKNGGAVASDILNVPDGRFAYCRDPDGTRFGLFTPS
jgi:predicted enzyme related to lactoylglutathione lyase